MTTTTSSVDHNKSTSTSTATTTNSTNNNTNNHNHTIQKNTTNSNNSKSDTNRTSPSGSSDKMSPRPEGDRVFLNSFEHQQQQQQQPQQQQPQQQQPQQKPQQQRQPQRQQRQQQWKQQRQQQWQQQQQMQQQSAKNGHEIEFDHVHGNGNGNSHGFDHQDNTSMSQFSSPSNTNTSNDANTASVSVSGSAIASTNNSNSISNNNSINNSRHIRNNSNASITSANNDPMGRSSHRNSLIYFSMDMDDVIDPDDNSDGQDENHDFDAFGGPSRSYSRETSNTVIEEEDEDEDDFQEAIENNDDEDEDDDHNNYYHNGNGNYGNGHNGNNFKNDNVNGNNNNNAGNMNINNNDDYYKENGQTQMMMNSNDWKSKVQNNHNLTQSQSQTQTQPYNNTHHNTHNNIHNHKKEILDIDESQVRYNNDEVDSLQRQQQKQQQQQQEWQRWQEWQQQHQQQYNNVNNNDSFIVEDHDKRGIVGEQLPNYNTKNDRAKRLSIKSSNSNSPNSRSSNSNSNSNRNIQQQKLLNVKDPIAVIQTTNSNAPILIFDPEQQLDDRIDIDINNNEDQSSKSSISTNSNSNSDSNSATYTQESQDFNEHHTSHNNNNNTNINTNNTRRTNTRQKSSSALDNLVEAASRPTFKRMESDTVLVDPETPPPLIDNKLRNVHDLEYDGDNDHDHHGDNNVNGVGYGENQSYDTATTSSSLNQRRQQHRQQHRQRRHRRHRENNNDNTHANENDHDQQLQQRRRHFQQQKRNISSNSQGSSICSSNSSSNRNNQSNRRLKRSSLERKKNYQNTNSSSLSNNSSSHGSSSCSISSHTSFSSQRYQIKNTDTGRTYDIRDLEIVKSDDDEEILQVKYSLFPSKYDLMERHNKSNDGDDEDSKLGSTSFSPLKDTRIGKSSMKAVSKTGRAVAKASQNISKGFLKRSKSEGAPLSSSSLQFGPLLEPFPKEDMGETNRFDAKMKSSLQEDTDEAAHKVEGDETKASKVHDNIDLTDSVKSTAKSQNQQQKSKRKKRNAKATPLGIPKNTLPVKCVNKSKSQSDFNPLLLISTLANAHDGPIWRASFCKDGEYLATAGSDGVLNIWKIAPTREQVQDLKTKESLNEPDSVWKGHWDEDDENNEDNALPTAKSESDAIATEVNFILPQPIQTFKEHTQDITDISWSNTGFLLSASFDNTVRLWHPTMSKSLHLFRHPDPVTSVSFDPNQDRYFLSGGFDKKIRIWDITNGRVVEWAQASHIITTATYQPDGTKIAAGLLDGKVIFYSVEGIKLKYFTEILCKHKRKKYGKKVTGLTFPDSEDKVDNDNDDDDSSQKKKTKLKKAATMVRNFGRKKKKIKQQVLITSNDSRLRLVGLNDFCMIRKYKGHHNPDVMMKARFSESGKFIIVGSEKTGKVTIWNTETRRNPLNVNITGLNMYDKMKEYECFDASKASQGIAFPIVTEALFAKTVSAKRAILNCGLFPALWTLDHINHDFSSAIIVSCDYGGTIRIFLRQASFDAVVHASGPMGYTESNS